MKKISYFWILAISCLMLASCDVIVNMTPKAASDANESAAKATPAPSSTPEEVTFEDEQAQDDEQPGEEARMETKQQVAQIALTQAMAQLHNKVYDDVNLTIGKFDGDYASGGVKFAGEMGGGWFLGAKENGAWVIVQDGNGTISCQKTDPYNFPVDMVPECYDEVTMQIVQR
ncbi:hypothetical protein GYA49_00425 [Candidatus Beckwithbacteria bacterium]|nr:hypothetical protein [Candidatus Beckwithbacteria bacterium]